MFLVEVAEGRRNHYPSAHALGAAIRCGELGPQARIFHQSSSQWLPITVHPEYRRAETEWEEDVARRWRARGWTFFSEKSSEAGSRDQPSPAPASAQVPRQGDDTADRPHRFRLGPAVRRLLHRDGQEA
ncbi:MAG: hypothetical protein ACTHM9_11205 [Gemmatimonadales bacterium]